jgi:RNA polymerase subunit RPABC4/transcription elongation factor Spt4
MLFVTGVFGIKNSTVNLAVDLLILFLVVVWLALVYWTYADARRRIGDPMLIGCATIASLFPFVGTIVYMIVRPPEYLDDVRERELEMQAAEARLAELGYHLCPHCDYEVEKDFLRCPNCMRKLRDPCKNCGKPLDPSWKLCPYCESEVGALSVQQRRPRRRATTSEQPVAGAAPMAERARSDTFADRSRSDGISQRGRAAGLAERERPTAAAAERERPTAPAPERPRTSST